MGVLFVVTSIKRPCIKHLIHILWLYFNDSTMKENTVRDRSSRLIVDYTTPVKCLFQNKVMFLRKITSKFMTNLYWVANLHRAATCPYPQGKNPTYKTNSSCFSFACQWSNISEEPLSLSHTALTSAVLPSWISSSTTMLSALQSSSSFSSSCPPSLSPSSVSHDLGKVHWQWECIGKKA